MKEQKKIRVSEIFVSIQGEGPFAGEPTLFVRLFGCNLTCRGYGCDSEYSWNPSLKHPVAALTAQQLADEIFKLLDGSKIKMLSFTGGEPMLWYNSICEVVDLLGSRCPTLLIETNGTITKPDLSILFRKAPVVYSISPKLSNSGEDAGDCISRAQAFASAAASSLSSVYSSYIKFVSDASALSFSEILSASQKFPGMKIWVMPQQNIAEQPCADAVKIAQFCIRHGFRYCARVHNTIFGNTKGT